MWIIYYTKCILYFRLSAKSVHKTVGPRQFYGHIEKLVDLGTSIDTEFQVSQNCQGPTVLWTLLTDNRKVSIKLLRSAVFVVLAYWVGKVSIKLPRSGSFLNMEKVSIKLLRSAVLSTQKYAQWTAKVLSSMDTIQNCRICQEFPSEYGSSFCSALMSVVFLVTLFGWSICHSCGSLCSSW